MKLWELIEELRQYNQEDKVWISYTKDGYVHSHEVIGTQRGFGDYALDLSRKSNVLINGVAE